MLDIIDLAKTLPGGRALFSGLSLTLAAGEYVAIMGESGVGKSTLLNLIAGLDPADAGEIRISGQRMSGLADEAAARRGSSRPSSSSGTRTFCASVRCGSTWKA